jgi:hypothetical protein
MTLPLFGPCKKPWGKRVLSAAQDPDGVTLLPPMLKGVKKKLWKRRRSKRRVMMTKLRMKPISNPLSLLVVMERGQPKESSRYKPHPKKSHQAPLYPPKPPSHSSSS